LIPENPETRVSEAELSFFPKFAHHALITFLPSLLQHTAAQPIARTVPVFTPPCLRLRFLELRCCEIGSLLMFVFSHLVLRFSE
jgi:hypothetical protein